MIYYRLWQVLMVICTASAMFGAFLLVMWLVVLK